MSVDWRDDFTTMTDLEMLCARPVSDRTEYMIEALIVHRDDPEHKATWEPWGHPRRLDSLDGELAQHRLAFLADRKIAAHSDEPQPPMRILDYRILQRTISTSPWTPTSKGGDRQ